MEDGLRAAINAELLWVVFKSSNLTKKLIVDGIDRPHQLTLIWWPIGHIPVCFLDLSKIFDLNPKLVFDVPASVMVYGKILNQPSIYFKSIKHLHS